MRKIGILLPRSSFYAMIGPDMFEGLRSGLQQLGCGDIRICTEQIGFGADKRECYAAAERLLLQEEVSVVFAYIGHRMAQLLRPLFMSMNKVLVVLDAGSSMPQEWPSSPNILFHSLHNSLSCWLTTQMAGRDGYREMGMVTGFYDGGYLQTYALALGCVHGGGQMVYNHATGYQAHDFTMAPLRRHVTDYPAACMLALFSGDYVQWFFDGARRHIGDVSPAVYASGYTLEETVLRQTDFPHMPVKGVVSWSRHISGKANEIFVHTLEEKGRAANVFSLLGWEAALMAVPLLDLLDREKQQGSKALAQFREMTFEGPRGMISFHEALHYSLSPMYEVNVVPDAEGKSALSVAATIDTPLAAFEQMTAPPLSEVVSGWYNSYVCI